MPARTDRRQILRGALAAALTHVSAPRALGVALSSAAASTGCTSAEKEPERPASLLRVPIAEISGDERTVREILGVPVEFRREGGEIVAISMLCSHQMCRVDWQPEDQRYLCPCHDGLFDADGEVVYGPPRRPLRRLTVRLEGDTAVVDVHEVYRAAEPPSAG